MEDNEILTLFYERDERAIEEIMARYGPLMRHVSYNILNNNEDVEECVSDACLSLWNSLSVKQDISLKAYVLKTIKNISLDRYKYYDREKRGGHDVPLPLDEMDEIDQKIDDPCDQILLNDILIDYIASLSPEKKAIFVARYWYFESIDSIAQRQHISRNKIYVMLHRCKKELKKKLMENGFL